jgi:hypothetical protein
MKNVQHGCHPCGQVEWNAEDCDVLEVLKWHPYAALEVVP